MPGIGGISGSAPVATTTTSGASVATASGGHLGAGVDLDAQLAQPSRLEVAEAQHLALARRQPGDLELAAELRRRAPRSRRGGRAGARSRAASMPAGPLPTTITRRGVVARLDAPRQLAPGLGVDRAARALAAADEVHAGVAGDARPQLVEPFGLAPCAASRARRSARGRAGRGRRRRGDHDRRRERGVVEPADGDHRHARRPA